MRQQGARVRSRQGAHRLTEQRSGEAGQAQAGLPGICSRVAGDDIPKPDAALSVLAPILSAPFCEGLHAEKHLPGFGGGAPERPFPSEPIFALEQEGPPASRRRTRMEVEP